MAEPSTHINYTFDDIQRYLQGKMSATEMHAMERAALQDPFLADAIEGYNEVPSLVAGRHLKEINAALEGEHKTSKVVAFSGKSQWLRIAALFIVLAGVGIIGFYVFNKSNSKQEVAQVNKDKESTNSTTPTIADTPKAEIATQALKANEEKNNNEQTEKKERDNKAEPKMEKITNDVAVNNEKETANRQGDAALLKTAPTAEDEMREEKIAFDSSVGLPSKKRADSFQNLQADRNSNVSPVSISGKIVDENNQPIPGVIVQSADKKQTVLSNNNGDFNLQKQDSLVTVSASAIGYKNKDAQLKAGNTNRIILQPAQAGLNEVVVTALGVKRSDSAINLGVTPVGGWRSFDHYVQKQLSQDTTADYYNYGDNDLVELEFSIDKDGNAVNIKFLQPLDAQRNAKALDIIKHGPKWMATENKKVRVRISF